MKPATLYTLVLVLISSLVSCSKSDEELTPLASSKLLKEVKIIQTHDDVPVDSSITAFEYNEKFQIVKRTNKLENDSYETYEYKDDVLVSLKSFYNGMLVQSLTNPVTVKGNKIVYTFAYTPAPSSPDSVLLQFSFDGNKMTEYRTTLLYPGSGIDEYIQDYAYSSNNLVSTTSTSIHDGEQFSPYIIEISKSDKKSNPYSNQSAMNKTLMSIGHEIMAHGMNNILESQVTSFSADVEKFEYSYDADGFVSTMKKSGSPITTHFYTYTR